MKELRSFTARLFTAPTSTEQLMRREQWTRDILSLMLVVSLIAAALILVWMLAGVFVLGETYPIFGVLAITLLAWWASRKGAWRAASFVPTLLCVALGAYGSYIAGFSNNLVLFYALGVLIAGILQGSLMRWLLIPLCTLAHIGLGLQVRAEPFLTVLAPAITVFFSLLGVAVIQWYFDSRLRHILAAMMAGNIALRDEIARREKVEAVQQEQETQLQRLAENISDMVAEVDPQGVFTYTSPSYFTALGYHPEDLLGTNAFNLVHPEDQQIALQATENAATSHMPQRVRVRARNASQSYLPVEVFGRALYRASGELQGFVFTSRDVSQQVQAELALQESERKFRNIIESIPLGIHMYTLSDSGDLIFTGSNPAADDILGIRHADRYGLPIEEAFPGLANSDIQAGFRGVALQGGLLHFEQFDYDDGQIHSAFDVHAFQTTPRHMVTVFSDIGERLRTAEALRQSEHKFATAFRTSPDSVNLNRLSDGVYIEVNQGFTRLMGYTTDDVIGKSSLELNIWVDPADRERLVKGLTQFGEVNNLEARFRRKNGDIGIGLMSARVIEIDHQKCILSITRDITERYQAESKLREAHRELEDAYKATLQGWAGALELRERETADHSRRVVEMTLRVAREMGIPEAELVDIQRGALLHDIGKLGVPDNILLKPGPLTGEEWVIMRQHPTFAYELIKEIPYLLPATDIPHYHHEHWDGSGYPCGLKGEAIPLAARIFAVVDVWDALLSDRPYRPAWPEAEVYRYLVDEKGKQFDPQVVDAFLKLAGPAPFNPTSSASTG